jgi:hypothetical protein
LAVLARQLSGLQAACAERDGRISCLEQALAEERRKVTAM